MSNEQAAVLARVQGAAIDGRLRVLRLRQKQFMSLHKALIEHCAALLDAMKADEGYSDAETKLIFGSALIELRNHYDTLDFESDLEREYALAHKKSNVDRRVAFGIAYVIPDPFTIFYSVISALCAALEVGTCVVVELQNTLQRTPALMRQVLSDALDREAFGFISSRAPVDFLAQCVVVDQVGKAGPLSAYRVLASPPQQNIALIDRTGNVALAAKEIVASCKSFKSASRYAVDLVFVNEFVSDEFNAAMKQEFENSEKATALFDSSLLSDEGQKPVKTTGGKLIEEEIASRRVQIAINTSSGSAAQIEDRRSALMTSKRSNSVIVTCKITSLDDVIDILNSESEHTYAIAALYLFSGAREAKYMSQHIKSEVTFVDHIPAQLAVGPMVPIGYATNLRQRYTRAMFETPSPQVVMDSRSHSISTILQKVDFIDKIAKRPLKATGQAPSGAWGFFEQGIILGALVYLLPIVSVSTFGLGYAAWKGYGSFR